MLFELVVCCLKNYCMFNKSCLRKKDIFLWFNFEREMFYDINSVKRILKFLSMFFFFLIKKLYIELIRISCIVILVLENNKRLLSLILFVLLCRIDKMKLSICNCCCV